MRKTLATLATCSLLATISAIGAAPAGATPGSAPAEAAAACTKPVIESTKISPSTVVLGVAAFKGIEITTKVKTNGCEVTAVQADLYGPGEFGATYDLRLVSSSGGVKTYETGLRIAPGDLANAEAGSWISYVYVSGTKAVNDYGPNFKVLRAARLTSNATPEPVAKGKTVTVRGNLNRANWETKKYAGYGRKQVELQFQPSNGSYKAVKQVTSATNGDLRSTVTASKDGCFRYVFKGNKTTAAVRSAQDCVDVR